jgi:hypothetical protein
LIEDFRRDLEQPELARAARRLDLAVAVCPSWRSRKASRSPGRLSRREGRGSRGSGRTLTSQPAPEQALTVGVGVELLLTLVADADPDPSPVEHTAQARERLGAGKLLAPEQAVILTNDKSRARELAREHVAFYMTKEDAFARRAAASSC